MTTVLEMPNRFESQIKRVMDDKDEFLNKSRNSQIITYSIEYFTNCFIDETKYLKAINIRLYNFPQNFRPEISQYMISWEDIPQDECESWEQFQAKVNVQLNEFLTNLLEQSKAIEEIISK